MTEKINFHCWEGYEQRAFLKPFESEFSAQVNAQTLLSDASTANQITSGNAARCHVVNINNAWVRDHLRAHGCVRTLDQNRFAESMQGLLSYFDIDALGQWAFDNDGNQIGICQRFGPFNFVVNTHRVDKASAEDQGFNLTLDKRHRGRYGILSYIDFNLFHLCIGAGIDPFTALSTEQLQQITRTANDWCQHASIISDDHFVLNRALINGDIDFYLSGGVYTAAVARRDGHPEVCAVTPKQGPMNGKGGIAFAEITSIIDRPDTPSCAEALLEWLLRPQTAASIAMTDRTCNPVAQMGNPAVMQQFSSKQLDWIQWDDLAESVARSSPYALMPNQAQVLAIWEKALQSDSHSGPRHA